MKYWSGLILSTQPALKWIQMMWPILYLGSRPNLEFSVLSDALLPLTLLLMLLFMALSMSGRLRRFWTTVGVEEGWRKLFTLPRIFLRKEGKNVNANLWGYMMLKIRKVWRSLCPSLLNIFFIFPKYLCLLTKTLVVHLKNNESSSQVEKELLEGVD